MRYPVIIRTIGMVFSLVLLMAIGAAYAAPEVNTSIGKTPYVADEYIIKVKPGSNLNDIQAGVARLGAQVLRALPTPNTYLIKFTSKSRSRSVGRYSALSRSATATQWLIQSIQPNYCKYAYVEPNDEYWSYQWDKVNLGLPKVWNTVKGSPSVQVGVLDTGVAYDHPDLENRVLKNLGYDFISDDNDAMDEEGHGTHVSGIIAAQGDDGIGITGVCWDGVGIVPIRVLDETGYGTTESVVNGINYATQMQLPVINMSLGSSYPDDAERSAVETYTDPNGLGGILVAAAGNSGDSYLESERSVGYPAAYPQSIAVASTGPDDKIAYYSSYGPDDEVDITAPGGDMMADYYNGGIFSTIVVYTRDTSGKVTDRQLGWTYEQGTSMASPQVAGGVALLMSAGISKDQIRDRLVLTARRPKRNYSAIKFGSGIMDLQAAIIGSVVKFLSPNPGATTNSTPEISLQLTAIDHDTVSLSVDGTEIIAPGAADNFKDDSIDGITFTLPIPGTNALAPGTHTLLASGVSIISGETMSDEITFTVAKSTVESGVYLFAFPYIFNTSTEGPSRMLPGANFSAGAANKARLMRWIAAPQAGPDGGSQYGYVDYNPAASTDFAWKSNTMSLNGNTWFINGGSYNAGPFGTVNDSIIGSGYWLILSTDTDIVEDLPSLESKQEFEATKGYQLRLYKGWNMIGNPFPKKISWQTCLFRYKGETKGLLSAATAGWLSAVAYGYDSTVSRDYKRITNRDPLEPYRGYWVRSYVGTVDDPLELIVVP